MGTYYQINSKLSLPAGMDNGVRAHGESFGWRFKGEMNVFREHITKVGEARGEPNTDAVFKCESG